MREAKEAYPLQWPDGWIRTRLDDRQTNKAWKKSANDARELLLRELERMGATSAVISTNVPLNMRGGLQAIEPRDPGVAVYFSKKAEADFSWQDILGINNPAPTREEINMAFRRLSARYHPDNQETGDLEVFKALNAARIAALKWADEREGIGQDYVIACDKFKEVRLNINAIRLTIAAIRQIERCGTSSLMERAFRGFQQITERASGIETVAKGA